jgi:hypothetical protein
VSFEITQTLLYLIITLELGIWGFKFPGEFNVLLTGLTQELG